MSSAAPLPHSLPTPLRSPPPDPLPAPSSPSTSSSGRTLPPEVLSAIALHLGPSPSELHRYLLVSRAFYTAVVPVLYARLSITAATYPSLFAGLLIPPPAPRSGRLERLRRKARMRLASAWPEESMGSDSEDEEPLAAAGAGAGAGVGVGVGVGVESRDRAASVAGGLASGIGAGGAGVGMSGRKGSIGGAGGGVGGRRKSSAGPGLFETFVLTQHGLMVEGGGITGLMKGAFNKLANAASAVSAEATRRSAGVVPGTQGWPNAVSHERKVKALAHARWIHVGDIPATRYAQRLVGLSTSPPAGPAPVASGGGTGDLPASFAAFSIQPGNSRAAQNGPPRPLQGTAIDHGPRISAQFFPNAHSLSLSPSALYYLADYLTRHRRRPHPFWTFLTAHCCPRVLCYRCIPLLREVYDEWIDQRQWMVSKQMDKLEWWEDEWHVFSERYVLDVLGPLVRPASPLTAPPPPPFSPGMEHGEAEENGEAVVTGPGLGSGLATGPTVSPAPWPTPLADSPTWPIRELVVHDYVRGIVPAPPGAVVRIHYTVPRCDCQIAHGIGSPVHSCTPYIDAQIRANGLARTLGYRGTETISVPGQRQAARRVARWEFSMVREKQRTGAFGGYVREWMRTQGTGGEGEIDWDKVEMDVAEDGEGARECACCETI